MSSTYPPVEHMLRDLRLGFRHLVGGRSHGWMPVVPELCVEGSRGVRAGALATLVDAIGGGLAAVAAHPDWIATADLTLHVVSAPATGTVEARAQVLRAGRTTVVIEVELVELVELGDGSPRAVASTAAAPVVGAATMSFSVLPRRDVNPDIRAARDAESASIALPGSGMRAPYTEMLGLRVLDRAAGVVEAPILDWSRNSFGALQGGAVATVVDAAAQAALSAATGRSVAVTDLHLTYLAPNRDGPVRTSTAVLDHDDHAGVARVELVDAGAASRRTAVAGVRAGASA